MAGTHIDTVLDILSKQELVQLFFNTDVDMGSKIFAMSNEIKDLLGILQESGSRLSYSKKRDQKALATTHL